jgi:SAM-dependent methyltransferase
MLTKNNNEFYEKIGEQRLVEVAKLAGLDTCCDVKLIQSLLKPEHAILEVGAGYGRVLNYLLSQGYHNLSAIELSKNFCPLLRKRFANQITLFEHDLLSEELPTEQKFDVVLWLWSGIGGFSKTEQIIAFKKNYALLKPNGKLIVDEVPASEQSLLKLSSCNVLIDKKNYLISYDDIQYQGYSNTKLKDEAIHYSKIFNLSYERLEYQTDNHRKRAMYIFSKL